jgi:uncharacterized membrane protein
MTASPRTRTPLDEADGACGPGGRWVWLPVGVLAAIVIAGLAIFLVTGGHPWWGPFPWFWPLFPLGFFLLFVLLFGAVRGLGWGWGGRWGYGTRGPPSAEEILRRRYASGEISSEQFLRMSRELRETS